MSRGAGIGLVVVVLVAIAASVWWFGPRNTADGPAKATVVAQYADIAHATYADSLAMARALGDRIEAFVANPSRRTLVAAREAWRAARAPYMQTEAFRFGNPPVDAWEGKVNAWPLAEGLIDYVAGDYNYAQGNALAKANIIASESIQVGSKQVDVREITPELLASLNEAAGSEANVTTGYHAIEFLLWGQDLHGINPGAGERPYTDYVTSEAGCTSGPQPAPARICERRAQYLTAATDLLISDLEYMVKLWEADNRDNYRARLTGLPPEEGIRRIMFGIGSLALGELAGERMKVPLIAHSTEDTHDCFSDNTHNSHYYDAVGIANVYTGSYTRIDGAEMTGPSVADLMQARNPEAARQLAGTLESALAQVHTLVEMYKQKNVHFDQMIAVDNDAGNTRIRKIIDSLVVLAGEIAQGARVVGLDNLRPDTAGHKF